MAKVDVQVVSCYTGKGYICCCYLSLCSEAIRFVDRQLGERLGCRFWKI